VAGRLPLSTRRCVTAVTCSMDGREERCTTYKEWGRFRTFSSGWGEFSEGCRRSIERHVPPVRAVRFRMGWIRISAHVEPS
jgi:hypothetical protein